MSDWSKEKIAWLRKARVHILPEYRRLSRSGRLLVVCENRDDVAIIFPKYCFAHLLGFTYFTDKGIETPGRLIETPGRLFDDLSRGPVNSKRIKYSNQGKQGTTPQRAHDLTEAKIGMALTVFKQVDVLRPDMYVVDSAKSRVVLFFGRSQWALGLAKEKTKDSGAWTGRYVPSSLIDDAILSDKVHRKGTSPAHVIDIRWI